MSRENAVLVQENLGGQGPEAGHEPLLRYAGIGTVQRQGIASAILATCEVCERLFS